MQSKDNKELIRRIALLLSQARVNSKKSIEYMAEQLDTSRTTIINWEKGETPISTAYTIKWFEVLGLNISKYLSDFKNPELKGDIASLEEEQVEKKFELLVDSLSSDMKKALLYIFEGNHDNSPSVLINFFLAYLHTPLTTRLSQAMATVYMYEMEKNMGHDPSPNDIQPNLDLLRKALAKASILNNEQNK